MKSNKIICLIHNIYKCIEYLKPVVIYLKNTNIKQRIQEVSKERENKWLQEVIEYHTSQGYGRDHGYKGFDGYTECLKARQNLKLPILNNLGIDKIIIEDPFEDWQETHKKLRIYIEGLSADK